MMFARLMVILVLGLGGMAPTHPAPVQAADPNWAYVEVGIGGGMDVSDDGTYCQYPTDFPIKAESDVKLTAGPTDEPVVDTLNSLIAETYNEGEKNPGDGCAIWARLDPVPMSTSYVIDISADTPSSSTYTGDMVVALFFWTFEFETSIGPDGGPACAPTTSTAMHPGGAFQSNPEGEVLEGIVGQVSGEGCRVSLIFSVPASDEITVAIGDAELDSNG